MKIGQDTRIWKLQCMKILRCL